MQYDIDVDYDYDDDRDYYANIDRIRRENRYDGLDCRDPDHSGCDMCEEMENNNDD